MKNILLPTDFSQNSWEAIQYAITLFKDCACTFYLMHSYEPQVSAPSTAVTSKRASAIILESMRSEATLGLQNTLKQIKSLPENNNHTFKTVMVNDYFVSAVKSKIAKLDIDVVVVGTKGASGLKEVTLGSNTAHLIGKLACPILAVPTDVNFKGLRDVGFATDFSITDYGDGLALLKDVATAHNAKISLVHVVKKEKELTPEQLTSQRALEAYLNPLHVTLFMLTDVPIEIGTRIFSESRQLDMMCVIAKKHSFFEKVFNKSQSKSISHHAKVPLIIFNEAAF